MKNLDPNKSKIDEKSYKNIFIYHIEYVTVKDLSHTTIDSMNPLHLICNKTNRYIKKSNGNKYLMPAPTDESKDTLKKYEDLWNKIRDIIR